MSRSMIPADYFQLFPWLTEQGQNSQADFWAEVQDLYSRGMDQALGLQENSLDQAVQLQSQALDLYRNAFGYQPLLDDYFKTATEFLTAWMELQMQAVTLMFSGRLPAPPNYIATAAGEPAETRSREIESSQRKAPTFAPERAAVVDERVAVHSGS